MTMIRTIPENFSKRIIKFHCQCRKWRDWEAKIKHFLIIIQHINGMTINNGSKFDIVCNIDTESRYDTKLSEKPAFFRLRPRIFFTKISSQYRK